MTIWLPYKANANERQKTIKQQQQRPRFCRICNKPINGGGHTCQSCDNFIKQMQKEERTGESERRRT